MVKLLMNIYVVVQCEKKNERERERERELCVFVCLLWIDLMKEEK